MSSRWLPPTVFAGRFVRAGPDTATHIGVEERRREQWLSAYWPRVEVGGREAVATLERSKSPWSDADLTRSSGRGRRGSRSGAREPRRARRPDQAPAARPRRAVRSTRAG